MNDNRQEHMDAGSITGKVLTAFWLIIFYLSSIWLVLGTMGARQFQDKINLLMEDNTDKKYNFLRITEIMDELDSNDNDRLKVQKIIQAMEDEVKTLTDERRLRYKNFDALAAKIESISIVIEEKMKTKSKTQAFPNLSIKNEELDSLLLNDPNISGTWNNYKKIKAQQNELAIELEVFEDAYAKTKEQLSFYRTKDTDLFSERSMLLSRYHDVAEHLNDFRYLRNMYAHFIAIMPDQLLTLILTLSMGALGSVIFLTRTYLEPTVNKPFTWYLFRPFLGAITALAIFILAKAGQITISDVSVSQGLKEALNPYFISFLAIISGLLSEQAIERIRSAGFSVFRSEFLKERWAVGLKSVLKDQGKTVSDILQFVSSPEESVKDWIEERKPVPSEEQRTISIMLGVPARKLFTDLPPL